MTAGITGVFWLPRMAEFNSATLNAGAHAIPISAAATAWGALTGAWIDATATVARVMAELGVGMQGVTGIAGIGRLGGFTGWAEQQGVMAAAMGAKAAANATAYTIASIAMPSLPEIVAVDTARVAAHSTGGVLNGTAEAAEAAKALLDLRAALTMETYEAATSAAVVTPGEFFVPPPIANGAGVADPAQSSETAFTGGDPVQGAIAAATAFAQNPGVVSAATQAANVAGSVLSGGVTTVGNVGASAISAMTSGVPSAATSMAPMSAMGIGSVAGAATATRSASSVPTTSINSGSLKLPEGWGAGASSGGTPAAAVTENVAMRMEGAPVRSTPTSSSSPLLGHGARSGEDDETEHDTPDYLRTDHFADGRYAADGVIGADVAGTAK